MDTAYSFYRLPCSLKKAKRAIRVVLERFLLPRRRLFVRVRSGLSQGLWIHARFPEESSYWRGKRDLFTERAILATVHKGSVVYDVGAHIGIVSFGAARLVGEAGRVVAFEADPENVASLRSSCVRNRFEQRMQVVHAAVWSQSVGEGVRFRRGERRRSHGGVAADGHEPVLADGPTVRVPSTTLDAFVASNGITPDLVKIDVEGGEYEVLRGGDSLFSCVRPMIIVEVHHAQALEQIANWMERFRYSAEWSIPEQGFPRMLLAWPAEPHVAV